MNSEGDSVYLVTSPIDQRGQGTSNHTDWVDFGQTTYSSPKSYLIVKKGLGDPTPTKRHVSVHRSWLSGCDEMSTEPSLANMKKMALSIESIHVKIDKAIYRYKQYFWRSVKADYNRI